MDNVHNPTKRVLSILRLLSTNPEGYTLSEIAREIDSSKSTLVPIMRTMLQQQFVILKSNSKYTLGLATYIIGSSYSSNITALGFIKDQMKDLVKQTDEICQLGILEGNNILYIAKEDPDNVIRLVSYVGKRLPLYCTAIGKALILDKNIDEIKELYPDGLKALTKDTITDFSLLEKELKESKKQGYTKEISETTEHISCIGIPLYKGTQIIASISISVPSFRFYKEKEKLIIESLKDKQKKINAFLSNNNVNIDDLINYK